MNHNKIVKEQLLHLCFGVLFFLVIGFVAISLDLLAHWVQGLGVSTFTVNVLTFAAHAMLILDLLLFSIYLVVTSIDLIKGMMK